MSKKSNKRKPLLKAPGYVVKYPKAIPTDTVLKMPQEEAGKAEWWGR